MRKLSLLVAVANMIGVAVSEPTYQYSDPVGDLTVTVASGEATLDAAKVVQGVTNIVKMGGGLLIASPISYRGDFTIREGAYRVSSSGDLGDNWLGTVRIESGATLVYKADSSSDYMAKGKTFWFAGKGAEGYRGAFHRVSGGSSNKFASNSTFNLSDDASWYLGDNRLMFQNSICLNDHELFVHASNTGVQFQFTTGVIKGGANGLGCLSVSNLTHLAESEFSFSPEEKGRYVIRNANWNIKSKVTANGWTMEANANTRLQPNMNMSPTETDAACWDGPVVMSGLVCAASSVDYSGTVTLKGDLSGDGELITGPGWVNVFSANNAYAGAVTISGKNKNVTGGGVSIYKGASFFPMASKVDVVTEATIDIRPDALPTLPVMTFRDDTDKKLVGGDWTVDGRRPSMAGFVKTGKGVLTIASPVQVEGLGDVQGGTLRIGDGEDYPGVGHPGVHEYWGEGNSIPSAGTSVTNWASLVASGVYKDNGVQANPRYAYQRAPYKGNTRRAWLYEGYLWNRTGADVTWQFAMSFSDWGAYFIIDDDTDKSMTGVGFQTKSVTLTPGPHHVFLFASCWGYSQLQPTDNNGMGFGVLKTPDPAQTNITKFAKLLNADDETLWTLDALGPDDFRKPKLRELRFAAGTAFDLNGADVALESLTGSPSVSGGALAVNGVWTLTAADSRLTEAPVLSSDGRIIFAPGAKLDIDEVSQMRRVRSPGLEICRAVGGIDGLPELTDALKEANWTLTPVKVNGVDTLRLSHESGLVLLFK